MNETIGTLGLLFAVTATPVCADVGTAAAPPTGLVHTYTLAAGGTPAAYDEAMVVACLQGLINREQPVLYLFSEESEFPKYWWDKLLCEGRWLRGKRPQPVAGIDELVRLAGDRVKGAVIWDPEVPATVNVATTIAGVEDLVVLSPELAEAHLSGWGLPLCHDLRDKFDGHETGSKKNDAYRWALREYLAEGKCSSHFLSLYEDAWSMRASGDLGYVVVRDWAVKNRSFVFDLSPWGDERPADDTQQTLGLDRETFRMILAETQRQARRKHLTEVAGFVAYDKYTFQRSLVTRKDATATEWETVYLMSPYGAYQNTVITNCYNQSFHSAAPFAPLKQHRPAKIPPLEDKSYICAVITDFDSIMPLYSLLPGLWDDPARGTIPLGWGVDPNLIETYPDIITYLYETASEHDYFVADASGAGYFNPSRVPPRHLSRLVRHNRHFFDLTDMSIAVMVLDWEQPSARVKNAYAQFAPDGYGTQLYDYHYAGGNSVAPHVWKGMPITNFFNDVCHFTSPQAAAHTMRHSLRARGFTLPAFGIWRFVYTSPTDVKETMAILSKDFPEINAEVVDPYTFFRLFKEWRLGLPE